MSAVDELRRIRIALERIADAVEQPKRKRRRIVRRLY